MTIDNRWLLLLLLLFIQFVHHAYFFHEDLPMTILQFMLIKEEKNSCQLIVKQYAQNTGNLHR